jgi:hypothetical protein
VAGPRTGASIGLEDPGIAGEMPVGVLAVAVARVEEQRGRRVGAGERPIVPDISPYSANDTLVFGQHRHGRVVAVQAFGGEPVPADQLDERRQARRAGADPVCQGRHVERDALAGIGLALPVEGLVLAKLGVKDHRQRARPGPRAGDDVERPHGSSPWAEGPRGQNLIVAFLRLSRPSGVSKWTP